jgi:CRISPR/Cas system-associated protein Csm6
MIIDHDDSMLVVLLDDMVHHSLPRVLAIREKMKTVDVLSSSELDFFIQLVDRINECHSKYKDDEECRVIFSTLSHLVYKVIHRAYKNEQAEFNSAAFAAA